MTISNATIEAVRNLEPLDIIGRDVLLTESGNSWRGLCPFHNDKEHPSFSLSKDTGHWCCYTCGEKGDSIDFIMRLHNLSFYEAITKLADDYNIPIDNMSPEEAAARDHYNSRVRLLNRIALLFHKYLTTTRHQDKNAIAALAYLTWERGITEDTITKFQIGYAPNDYYMLVRWLVNEGYTSEELLETGLIRAGNSGLYTAFRGRIVFPIKDAQGNVVGFGGRTMEEVTDKNPKYLNSPNSDLFNKRQLLYGLYEAKPYARKANAIVVVEGYLDVVLLHQQGFQTAVAVMGTALGNSHAQTIKQSGVTRAILAMDGDKAGSNATLRIGLNIEKTIKLDLYIAQLPYGYDPDQVAVRSPEEWQSIIDKARPIVVFITDTLVERADGLINDPKVKRDIFDKVNDIIKYVESPIERAGYIEYVVKKLGIEHGIASVCPHCGRSQFEEK
jgi:DNA primase